MTAPDLRASRSPGYERHRPHIVEHVPSTARKVLDLGCASGANGAAIKARQDAYVVGVEIDPDYAAEAATRIDRVVVADVEQFARDETQPEAPFDALICADVLEHLRDPWATLSRAATMLSPGATVVVSVPNVLYYRALLRIVGERRWPREDVGIFDRTHLRWFSRDDAVDLCRQAGLTPERVVPLYWGAGRRRQVVEALGRTRLVTFMPAQHVVVATKP